MHRCNLAKKVVRLTKRADVGKPEVMTAIFQSEVALTELKEVGSNSKA